MFGKYEELIRDSEQLRIIKNFVALENVYSKSEIETLIKAMEYTQTEEYKKLEICEEASDE